MVASRSLPALSESAPDFLALLTDRERPVVEEYYAKIQKAPDRYEAMMTPGEHSPIHFVRLAYRLAWFSMARQLFAVPLGVLVLFGLPGAILGGWWRLLVLPGLAIGLIVGFTRYPHLADRMQTFRAFFTDLLGLSDPGNKRMM